MRSRQAQITVVVSNVTDDDLGCVVHLLQRKEGLIKSDWYRVKYVAADQTGQTIRSPSCTITVVVSYVTGDDLGCVVHLLQRKEGLIKSDWYRVKYVAADQSGQTIRSPSCTITVVVSNVTDDDLGCVVHLLQRKEGLIKSDWYQANNCWILE
ncbi:hypothetical protein J6590_016579 [Homalodisca vitripennis]|nr:hypothetical protein J6590_016579 [Homalodisca vitripennis]